MEARRPTTERRRPFRAEGLMLEMEEESVAVRNGRENSRPEKGRRKRRWVMLRRAGWLVYLRWLGAHLVFLAFEFGGLDVSTDELPDETD
jgi:hypothetical protein